MFPQEEHVSAADFTPSRPESLERDVGGYLGAMLWDGYLFVP